MNDSLNRQNITPLIYPFFKLRNLLWCDETSVIAIGNYIFSTSNLP